MATTNAVEEIAAATSEPAGGGFVARFGLDPWLFLAQAVNFLIVAAVLTRFVFRPLLKTTRARSAKIAQGVQEAAATAALRTAAETERRRVLQKASADASAALRRAEEDAHRIRDRVLHTAEEEAEAMHDRAEQETIRLKEDTLRSVTSEAGELVVDAVEQVLAETLTSRERARYREAALRALKTVRR